MNCAFPSFSPGSSSPLRIGAITPSSAALAAAITSDLTHASAPVIELRTGDRGIYPLDHRSGDSGASAGTHRVPVRLVRQGYDGIFRAHRCIAWTRRVCQTSNYSTGSARERSSAVSPLLLMPTKSKIALLRGAFQRLRSDGAFYQFTYGHDAPCRARHVRPTGTRSDAHQQYVCQHPSGFRVSDSPPAIADDADAPGKQSAKRSDPDRYRKRRSADP